MQFPIQTPTTPPPLPPPLAPEDVPQNEPDNALNGLVLIPKEDDSSRPRRPVPLPRAHVYEVVPSDLIVQVSQSSSPLSPLEPLLKDPPIRGRPLNTRLCLCKPGDEMYSVGSGCLNAWVNPRVMYVTMMIARVNP